MEELQFWQNQSENREGGAKARHMLNPDSLPLPQTAAQVEGGGGGGGWGGWGGGGGGGGRWETAEL